MIGAAPTLRPAPLPLAVLAGKGDASPCDARTREVATARVAVARTRASVKPAHDMRRDPFIDLHSVGRALISTFWRLLGKSGRGLVPILVAFCDLVQALLRYILCRPCQQVPIARGARTRADAASGCPICSSRPRSAAQEQCDDLLAIANQGRQADHLRHGQCSAHETNLNRQRRHERDHQTCQ